MDGDSCHPGPVWGCELFADTDRSHSLVVVGRGQEGEGKEKRTGQLSLKKREHSFNTASSASSDPDSGVMLHVGAAVTRSRGGGEE